MGAQGQSVTDLIKRVFPEEMKVQSSQSSSNKNTNTDSSLSADEEFMRSRGKRGTGNNKSSSFKGSSVVIEKLETSTVIDSTDENIRPSGSSTGTSTDTSTGVSQEANSAEGASKISTSSSSSSSSSDSRSSGSSSSSLRPGLVFETHNNLVSTYVSGIAVRPY